MPHPPIPPSIAPQLAQAQALLQRHLAGTTLHAIHLFGSAVDGGLQHQSDIDLLVTVQAPPTESVRQALMRELLAISGPPGAALPLRPLEITVLVRSEVVPWRYRPRRELQFGEWLRDDLQAGIFEPPTTDHDLAILLTKVRQHSIALLGPEATELLDPVPHADLVRALQDTVAQWNAPDDWAGDERNIVLALARIWYTAATGRIAAKDQAADWLLLQQQQQHGGPLQPAHRAVLAHARAAYLGQAPDELASQPDAVAAFVRVARAEIEQLCAA